MKNCLMYKKKLYIYNKLKTQAMKVSYTGYIGFCKKYFLKDFLCVLKVSFVF